MELITTVVVCHFHPNLVSEKKVGSSSKSKYYTNVNVPDCDKQTRLKCVVLIATVTVSHSILVLFQKGRLRGSTQIVATITFKY
jgi:hypothetical protein